MAQGIAGQILSETPSSTPAPVNANTQEAQTDTNTNPQTTETKPGDDFDARFGVLTKMERKLQEERNQWRTQQKEMEDKLARMKELEELADLLDKNPLEALKKKKGWGVQEFNEFALQNSSDEDLDPVAKITRDYQAKMAELEEKLTKTFEEKISAKEAEIMKREQDSQVNEFKHGVKTFLAENKSEYELIHAEGAQDEVFDLIYGDLQKQIDAGVEDPKIMDVKEAAEKIEAYLDKQVSKYLGLNKVKSKLQGNENPLANLVTKSETPKTLNSNFAPKSKPLDQLSEQERRQAAIAHIRAVKQQQAQA